MSARREAVLTLVLECISVLVLTALVLGCYLFLA